MRYMGPEFSIYTCIEMCRVMYPPSIFTDDTNINIKSYQISLRLVAVKTIKNR